MDLLKLFLTTGLMGKFILLFLLGMSLISWYYIFLNLFNLRRFDAILSESLEEAESLRRGNLTALRFVGQRTYELSRFINRLSSYLLRAKEDKTFDLSEIEEIALIEKENLSLRLACGLGYLATCANTAPFIGLFGTVWGIMSAFHDIGLKGSASLTTVAPGIAEALVNTAMGLFVAIPASMAYNYFTLKRENVSKKLEIFVQKLIFYLKNENS